MRVIDAVYSGGTFHPVGKVNLPENQRVRLTVDPVPVAAAPGDPLKWLEEAKAFREKLAEEVGMLPDSTAIIRADRDRDV